MRGLGRWSMSSVLLAAVAAMAQAQGADSAFARAKRLFDAGNGAAGRVVIDSVLASTAPSSALYADALYWRARVAAGAKDAERDYLQVIVDYPFSRYYGNALNGLAQLELSRNDRVAAAGHLERFVLESERTPEHGPAGLRATQLLFEQSQPSRACAVLGAARAAVAEADAELRNRLEFYSPRCSGVDTTSSARAAELAESLKAPPAPSTPTATAAAPAARGTFTVQVGAFQTKAEADRTATRLRGQGLEARVVGTKKPFRVRVGRFMTSAEAQAMSKQLTAKKISNFVTTTADEDK